MTFRGFALLLCIVCRAHCLLEQSTQTKNETKDVLLEPEAAHSAAIEELRKKIDEIVKELNALKEVHALQLGNSGKLDVDRVSNLEFRVFPVGGQVFPGSEYNGLQTSPRCSETPKLLLVQPVAIRSYKPVYICLKGIKVPGKCFLASSEKKDFYAATDDCIFKGGSLSTPVTGNENYQLYVYVHETIGPRAQIWLGINDMLKEGDWVDKTGSRIRFQNWETEVTRQPVGGRSQNCAFMSVIDSGKWFDESCRAVKPFVCEFNIV